MYTLELTIKRSGVLEAIIQFDVLTIEDAVDILGLYTGSEYSWFARAITGESIND